MAKRGQKMETGKWRQSPLHLAQQDLPEFVQQSPQNELQLAAKAEAA